MQSRFVIGLFLLLFGGISLAVDRPPAQRNPHIETEQFRIRLSPRTPNQIAAFYEARGFPGTALAELRKTCFITVGIHNKSKTILWHDLSTWRILGPQGEIRRYMREDWWKRWDELGVAKRLQSTFRWTLMPEKLDFRPDEAEGGNIIIPRTDQALTITGELYLGEQKNKLYQLKFENVYCATD